MCCHFAICGPACPVQCGAFTPAPLALCRVGAPFLLLLGPIQSILLSFKWAVDEVSLIRLSQLTLLSAVCFPSKGVLTSPMLPLYPPLCTFHPASPPPPLPPPHPKKPFSTESNGLLYIPRFPNDIGYLEWVTRPQYTGKGFKVAQ